MFFELENTITEVCGVDQIRWNKQNCDVVPRKYCALAFRTKGEGVIHYNGKEIFVGANDILYMPQNIGYSAEYTDTEIFVIHFVTSVSDDTAEVFSLDNTEKIYKLYMEALNTWQNKKTGYKIFTLSLLYQIIGIIYKEQQIVTLPKSFVSAVSLIHSSFKDSTLSIKNICFEAGIGETYFRKLFSEHYKKKPTAYINELRIEYARNLISSGLSIEKAAIASGFEDSKYFARVVKQYYGCTPREWKDYGK